MTQQTMTDTLIPFYEWPAADTATVMAVRDPLDTLVLWLQPWFGQGTSGGADTVWRSSMFASHELYPSHTALVEHGFGWQPVWLFVALVLLTALTLVYFISRNIKLPVLLKSAIDRRSLDRMVRDCNLGRTMLMVSMGLLYCASLGTSLWLIALRHTGMLEWLLVVAAMSVAYLLRNGVLRMLGRVFDGSAAVGSYITSNYIYHLIATTAMLPLLFLQAYLPGAGRVVGMVVVGLAAVTFLARFGRGSKLFLTFSKGSSLYLFYYLCIVEIVPFLVLIKWIIADQPGS